MEQSKLSIRLANSNDAEKICALLNIVSPEYDRKINFWIWINRMLSEENSIIAVAEFNSEIVGHYAIIPQKIIINQKVYRVGLGIHALIRNDKRNIVSIYQISNLAYIEAKRIGLKFVYGFPNKNYRLIQEKIERWKKVKLFKSYEFKLGEFKLDTKWESFQIKKIDTSFNSFFEISKILDAISLDSNVYLDKNLNYYLNRYLFHPHKLYETYIVENEKGKKACLFLKKFKDSENIKGHLIDFIKEDEFDYKSLLDSTVLILKKEKIKVLSFWPVNSKIKHFFDLLDIKANGFETFFAVKFLDKIFDKEYKELLLNLNNWTLNMGDSDAF